MINGSIYNGVTMCYFFIYLGPVVGPVMGGFLAETVDHFFEWNYSSA